MLGSQELAPTLQKKRPGLAVVVKRFDVVEMTNWSTLSGMSFSLSINSLRLIAWIAILPLAAAAQPSMKAIVIHSSGGPEVLKYEDTSRPQPEDDEVLIRVIAEAVYVVYVLISDGRYTLCFYLFG